jgi:hypothetical protein
MTLSMDVLSLQTFCPHGRFVCRMLCPTDVLSLRMFCPTDVLSDGRFVATDVSSPRTFCPYGRYVHGCFVSGRFVSGRFVWAPFLLYCAKKAVFVIKSWGSLINFNIRGCSFSGLGLSIYVKNKLQISPDCRFNYYVMYFVSFATFGSTYCFAPSPRRPSREYKRMVLELTHGLFIT